MNAVTFAILAVIVGIGLSGAVGGRTQRVEVATSAASASIATPPVLRNGELFETVISLTLRRDVRDLVIAVPNTLWRDVTINSLIPAPAEEEADGTEFRFHFGSHSAGDTLTIKIDGQINPARFGHSEGVVAIREGNATLARLPYQMRIMP